MGERDLSEIIEEDEFHFEEERIEAPVAENPNAQEVDWTWKRQTLQGSKASVNLYVRLSVIDQIKTELRLIGDEVYEEFTNSCFGRFVHFHLEGYSCNVVIHALMAREVRKPDAQADERWFRIGEQFMRFSKYEFALVTGLRFGDSAFDPNAPPDPPETGVYMTLFGRGGRLVLDDLRNRFTRGDFRQSAGVALKIAKVLFLYYILFALDGGKTSVDRWVWALVEDTEQWESFPWGKYSFQILLRYIDGLPICIPPTHCGRRSYTYHFYGCSLALLVWAYEAIPLLGSTYGNRVLDNKLQRPRCLRWKFKKISADMNDFFTSQMECLATLEPSIDEQQQLYWQHIDEDLRSGIQYVPRESRFRRPAATTVSTPAQRMRTSRNATPTRAAPILGRRYQTSITVATASDAPIPIQRPRTSRTAATTDADSIPSPRSQKRRRIVMSSSSGRDASHGPNSEARIVPPETRHHDDAGGVHDEPPVAGDDSMLTRLTSVIRQEVGRLERRIGEEVDRLERRIKEEADRLERRIREEADRLERRIPEIIREDLRDFFHLWR